MPVHRRKADVGDLVERLQLLHHRRADFGGADLTFGALLQRRFHAVGNGLDGRRTDRPLFAGFEQTANQFLTIEPLPGAVLLDDHVRDLVDALVARETLAAPDALAPAANDLPFFALARIDDLVAQMAAIRTFHRLYVRSGSGWSASCFITAMFSPACAAKKSPRSKLGPIVRAWSTIAAP